MYVYLSLIYFSQIRTATLAPPNAKHRQGQTLFWDVSISYWRAQKAWFIPRPYKVILYCGYASILRIINVF
jgi:hypothetical protein